MVYGLAICSASDEVLLMADMIPVDNVAEEMSLLKRHTEHRNPTKSHMTLGNADGTGVRKDDGRIGSFLTLG